MIWNVNICDIGNSNDILLKMIAIKLILTIITIITIVHNLISVPIYRKYLEHPNNPIL